MNIIINDTEHHFLVGYRPTNDSPIIGYIHAEVYTTLYSASLFNVLGLGVIESHQGMGIGKKLLLALEEEGVLRKIAGIRLNSGAEREKAHEFYQHMGYLSKDQKRFLKYFS